MTTLTDQRRAALRFHSDSVTHLDVDGPDGVDVFVWWATAQGSPAAAVFGGKRTKPDWMFCFESLVSRDSRIASWLHAQRERVERRTRDREASRSAALPFAVGDCLTASWGYDQTQVDAYEVTALIGRRTVVVQRVRCEATATGSMVGKVRPIKGALTGEPIRVRWSGCGDGLTIERHHARPTSWDEWHHVSSYA